MPYSHTSNWIDSFLHQDEGALFQFAGTHSLTASRLALEAAKQFIDEGRDSREVRTKTGWFMGEDNSWRYEISDHDSAIKAEAFTSVGNSKTFKGRLGQILDHPKLFAAYPFLASVKVTAEIHPNTQDSGQFRPSSIDIEGLNALDIQATSSTLNGLQETLLHEVQHSIQDAERFAAGTSSAFIKSAYINSLFEREEALNKRLSDLSITRDQSGIIGREIDIIQAELTHIELAKRESMNGNWNDAFYSLYMNHSGEREARVTARDWQLTPAERLAREPLLPEIPSFKPIITFNDVPYQAVAAELNLTPTANVTLLPKESLLKLTQAADRDTFNHEAGHIFLHFEAITAQGRRPSAFQNKILDYLGVNSFADIKRVHDEKFARGFEQYLRERSAELNAPKGMDKVFNTVQTWVGNLGKTLIEKETPLSPAARAMFDEMLSVRVPPNPINVDQAEKQQRMLAMKLIDTGIYQRGDAYGCATLFAEYALAKCERDPDFPTVDRVFDHMNLRVEQAQVSELKADIKFDFDSFDLDLFTRDQIGRGAPPQADHELNQYHLDGIDNSISKDRTQSKTLQNYVTR